MRRRFLRRGLMFALGRCPKCKAPGAGPFVHRGNVFGVCDVDAVRWPLALSSREVQRLDVLRLAYAGENSA